MLYERDFLGVETSSDPLPVSSKLSVSLRDTSDELVLPGWVSADLLPSVVSLVPHLEWDVDSVPEEKFESEAVPESEYDEKSDGKADESVDEEDDPEPDVLESSPV